MNRRRAAAAAFFSVVIVAVLGVMVFVQASSNPATVTVFILRHPVLAGSPYTDGDVVAVSLHAAVGDFNYERRAPGQVSARYTQDLAGNDIVRADDLAATSASVEVAITLQSPPPLSVGDRIDVFAAMGGGRQARIGQDVTVLSASGGSLSVLIPVADEAAWISVASSSTALHAVQSVTRQPAALRPLAPGEAVSQLCGASCTGVATPP
ncbi:MAG: hypothetical protein M3R48_02355 [Candidatus Dormibacteraeota bacterium]|nr:hypothetical protein [Candidatus Dormibacteraeota bacterium]